MNKRNLEHKGLDDDGTQFFLRLFQRLSEREFFFRSPLDDSVYTRLNFYDYCSYVAMYFRTFEN